MYNSYNLSSLEIMSEVFSYVNAVIVLFIALLVRRYCSKNNYCSLFLFRTPVKDLYVPSWHMNPEASDFI